MACDVIRGAFGKYVAGTMYILRNAWKNSIKNTFLETRIQRLHDGLIFIEKKGLGVHVHARNE